MRTCIGTVLIPLASANVTVRREMEKTSNLAMDRMEEKINAIMQRSIDVVITWVNKLLARQLKTDFRPRDDALGEGAWLEQLQTPVSIFFEHLIVRSINSVADMSIDFQLPDALPQPGIDSTFPFSESQGVAHGISRSLPRSPT